MVFQWYFSNLTNLRIKGCFSLLKFRELLDRPLFNTYSHQLLS